MSPVLPYSPKPKAQYCGPRCSECGKFIGYKKDHWSYTPFADAGSWEPPDPQDICLPCWEALAERQATIYYIAWYGPNRVTGSNNMVTLV